MFFKYILLTVFLYFSLSYKAFSQSTGHYESALKNYSQEKYSESFIHLKNALKDNPENLSAKILLGKIYVHQRLADAAIHQLNEASDLGADYNLYAETLAKAYMINKDYSKVIDLPIDDLNYQSQFELTLLKAKASQNIERNQEALENYNKALMMQPNNISALTHLAGFYLQQGNTNEVEKLLTKAALHDANNPHFLHLKGKLHLKNNELTAALNYFQQAIEKAPNDAAISRSLANLYITLKDYPKARVAIDNILDVTPDDPFMMLMNARLFSINNENELADQAYTTLAQKLTLIPEEVMAQLPELQYVSGLADYMLGKLESAQKHLQSFLAQKDDQVKVVIILADIYIKQQQNDRALKLLEDNEQLVMQDIPAALILCKLYIGQQNPRKCIRVIDDLRKNHKTSIAIDLTEIKALQALQQYSEALDLFEKKFNSVEKSIIRELAISLQRQNNHPDKALEIVNELLLIKSTNISYQLLKVDILIELKKFEEANIIVKSLLETNPDLFTAKYKQAQLSYIAGEFITAQKQLERLISQENNSKRLYLLLANTLLSQGKLEQALDEYFKAERLSEGDTLPAEQIIKVYTLMNKLDLALAELNQLSKSHFLEPKYIQAKADIYLKQGERENAAQQYKMLYSMWSNEYRKLLFLGQKQRIARLFKDSEQSLNRALDLEPNFLYTKIELIRLYVSSDEISKAEILSTQLLESHNDNADIQLLAGDIAQRKQAFKQAQQYYLKAIYLDNTYHNAAIRLSQLAINKQLGRLEFEKLMKAIIAKYPDSNQDRHLLADYLLNIGNHQQALEQYLYLAAIPELPNIKFIFNNLANLYLNDDIEKASNFIDKALGIDNSNANFFDTKGWVLSKQKNYDSALFYLRQAFSLNSKNPSIRYHIAFVLVKLEREEEAKLELKAALTSSAYFAEQQHAQQLLESL